MSSEREKYREALKTLKELFEEGLIDKEEFDAKKATILDKLVVFSKKVSLVLVFTSFFKYETDIGSFSHNSSKGTSKKLSFFFNFHIPICFTGW